jgi:hypothetical protein
MWQLVDCTPPRPIGFSASSAAVTGADEPQTVRLRRAWLSALAVAFFVGGLMGKLGQILRTSLDDVGLGIRRDTLVADRRIHDRLGIFGVPDRDRENVAGLWLASHGPTISPRIA